ncbi:M15 family metallopeptidase [Cellvibrio japonicus]|uniref:D-alanyl-D-alanine carboxypeptidase n=1 Tax=Cellvibrio japonicus (strain Ueda107) TaxID=498211 RepID=B3PJ09_CELJU|nr:M15 family metallopeptidase [Cellvibrio japonicus]ACE84841.1 D-alanyl-D-alanine carboxypeptidase [Cellvibrio japonicus Ueda107]QEI11211.1 M15 family metallopeptidase [Cellvibrio japonicus]QEI14785.1 M15 family metallopeptidase [Cellvibrio japonicus]QEI18365.1 M15 family metallopeptidase [Cellvibrio japonicus]
MLIESRFLLGLDNSLLIASESYQCQLQAEVLAALDALSARAAAAGFSVRVASGYRNFARQLSIWNNKAEGRRPVLDDRGEPLDMERLSEREKVFSILRWSALPGASRHHWGTDLDIYDASRMPACYEVKLTQAETCGDGVFAAFHRWLDTQLQAPDAVFYRPYAHDRGGVAPEPWHLSYAPVAQQYARALTLDVLYEQLLHTDLALKETVLAHLPEIYSRFVRVDH